MFSITKLRKEADNLDPDDGIKFTSQSEVSIVCESGDRIDISRDLALRIFGSVENLGKIRECFSGSESLELHNVKLSDEVWVLIEEIFVLVDEV
jgi:hypothetical protein